MSEQKQGDDELLTWCQTCTKGYKSVDVTDFKGETWRDGLALCALCHSLLGDQHVPFATLDPTAKKANVELAFSVAERECGVDRHALSVDDVAEGKVDQQILRDYCDKLHAAFAAYPPPRRSVSHPAQSATTTEDSKASTATDAKTTGEESKQRREGGDSTATSVGGNAGDGKPCSGNKNDDTIALGDNERVDEGEASGTHHAPPPVTTTPEGEPETTNANGPAKNCADDVPATAADQREPPTTTSACDDHREAGDGQKPSAIVNDDTTPVDNVTNQAVNARAPPPAVADLLNKAEGREEQTVEDAMGGGLLASIVGSVFDKDHSRIRGNVVGFTNAIFAALLIALASSAYFSWDRPHIRIHFIIMFCLAVITTILFNTFLVTLSELAAEGEPPGETDDTKAGVPLPPNASPQGLGLEAAKANVVACESRKDE